MLSPRHHGVNASIGSQEHEVRRVASSTINGRNPSFRAADALDGNETVEGTSLDALKAVGALTVHVINAASHAWGKWHFVRSGRDFDAYLKSAAELKTACAEHLLAPSAMDP